MPNAKLAVLGSKIQHLTTDVQDSRDNDPANPGPENELLDALDDLRAEIVGPARWLGAFLAPPEFAALQVAFQRSLFQRVPLQASKSNGTAAFPPIHLRELARSVDMNEDILLRIMRVLAVNKLFSEVDEKVFAHTELSAGLAQERVAALWWGMFNELYKASSSLGEAIAGGHPSAWVARFGMPLYEYLEKQDSGERQHMEKSMAASSRIEIEDLSTMYPWDRYRKVVDIGGGAGHVAVYLSQKHPHLQLVNQDLPQVTNDAVRRIDSLPAEEKAAYERVKFEVHDYHNPQTQTDADVFILRRCMHNNSDADCVSMLKAVTSGLERGGQGARLLLNEKIMPPWNAYTTRHATKMLRREDIIMMISVGGRERTLEDFRTLLRAADGRFEIDQVYSGRNHLGVVSVKLVNPVLDSSSISLHV